MKAVELSIEKIKFDDSPKKRSQVRQSGIVPKHVQDLVYSIKANGQKVPVIVEKVVGSEELYRCTDGNHRCTAIREINETNPQETLKVKAFVRSFSSTTERIEEQLRSNHHDPALSNTKKDLVAALTELIKVNGAAGDFGDKRPKEVLAVIRNYAESLVPGHKEISSISKEVFYSLPSDLTRVKNYTKPSAIEWFNDHNYMNLSGIKIKSSGDLVDGKVYYFGGRISEMSTAVGQAIDKRIKIGTSLSEVIFVSWMQDCVGKEPDSIVKFRHDAEQKLRRANEFCNREVFSKLIFIPQIEDSDHKTDFAVIDLSQPTKTNSREDKLSVN